MWPPRRLAMGSFIAPVASPFLAFRAAADDLIANVVEGVSGPLLAHLVERAPLNEADLDAIQLLIERKKQLLRDRGNQPADPTHSTPNVGAHES